MKSLINVSLVIRRQRQWFSSKINKNMQKIMEIYNLSMDIDKQLSEVKAWNI